MKESELVGPVVAHLRREGYRAYPNADTEDFFDVVARRGEELGIVELKVADWSHAVYQAVERRRWADWVVIVLPRSSLAERARRAMARPPADRIGVWFVAGPTVHVVRPARPFDRDRLPPEWHASRTRLEAMLDLLDRGEMPAGARWASAARAPGPRGRGRWRLEEFVEGEGEPAPD